MNIVLTNIVVTIPPRQRILFRIHDFRIPFGSRVVVHGPSGIGKTTLLHLIAGLFLPDEGDVTIGNDRLRILNDRQRSRLRRDKFGIVFQRLNLVDHLNAIENVVLPLRPAVESSKRATEALRKLGLANLAREPVAHLSLGEQQRVAVARVLATSPLLILADEPTSSLDERNAFEVFDALWTASEQKTLLVVSHDKRIHNRFDTVIDFRQLTTS